MDALTDNLLDRVALGRDLTAAYLAACKAEDAYKAALKRAGLDRWTMKKPGPLAVQVTFDAKVAADARLHEAFIRQRNAVLGVEG